MDDVAGVGGWPTLRDVRRVGNQFRAELRPSKVISLRACCRRMPGRPSVKNQSISTHPSKITKGGAATVVLMFRSKTIGWATRPVLGALDQSPYWGRAVLMAAIALIVPVAGFRDLWSEVRFWVTVTVAALFQIPVLMALQPIGQRSGVAFMLGFTIADGLLIIAMIYWACLRHEN